MELIIILKQNELQLEIRQKGQTIDLESAKYYYNLDEVLISGLDKLLKKNRISPKALKTYKIQADLGEDSTSYKIASVFIKALQI